MPQKAGRWYGGHAATSIRILSIRIRRRPRGHATSGASRNATSGASRNATSGASRQAPSGASRQAPSGASRQAPSGASRHTSSGQWGKWPQFVSQYHHIRRGFNPQPHFVPRHPDHSHHDILAHANPLALFSRKHEHCKSSVKSLVCSELLYSLARGLSRRPQWKKCLAKVRRLKLRSRRFQRRGQRQLCAMKSLARRVVEQNRISLGFPNRRYFQRPWPV
jgi:hypothetical protein